MFEQCALFKYDFETLILYWLFPDDYALFIITRNFRTQMASNDVIPLLNEVLYFTYLTKKYNCQVIAYYFASLCRLGDFPEKITLNPTCTLAEWLKKLHFADIC